MSKSNSNSNIPATLEEYQQRLAAHDWTGTQSDDHSVYLRARREELQLLAGQLNFDLDRTLWNRYRNAVLAPQASAEQQPVAKVTSYDPMNGTGTVQWFPAQNGVPRKGFEVGADLYASAPQASQPSAWNAAIEAADKLCDKYKRGVMDLVNVHELQRGIRALRQQASAVQTIPSDHVIVPIEPTEEMVDSGAEARIEAGKDSSAAIGEVVKAVYLAMLSAAPSAAQQAPAVQEDNLTYLLSTMDAKVWADEYCKRNTSADHEAMLAWFASAIMTGFDEANRRNKTAQPAAVNVPSGWLPKALQGPAKKVFYGGNTNEHLNKEVVLISAEDYKTCCALLGAH